MAPPMNINGGTTIRVVIVVPWYGILSGVALSSSAMLYVFFFSNLFLKQTTSKNYETWTYLSLRSENSKKKKKR